MSKSRSPRPSGSARSSGPSRPRDLSDGTKNPYVRYRPLKKPVLEEQVTTLWDFPSQHYGNKQQGLASYKGATPSYVIWNILEKYTKPGDVVLDPFCGSGTTLDVCEDLDRKGIGFDLHSLRESIGVADARTLPLDNRSIDLAFLDPPYADNLVYSDDDRCIGKTFAEDGSYLEAMEEVFEEMLRVVKVGGIIAVYVQDIYKKKDGTLFPLGAALLHLGVSGFDLVDHVCVVRRNKDLEKQNYKQAAIDQGFMLRGFNHLLLFRVPQDNEPLPPEQRRQRRQKAQKPRGEGGARRQQGRGERQHSGQNKNRSGKGRESRGSRGGPGKPRR
ncbi:MAG: hypothetical protein GY822_26450 [Deltaproteobacteria bacterium]|nr:hypothetical protein [Deltaproteobacteria bacterium]